MNLLRRFYFFVIGFFRPAQEVAVASIDAVATPTEVVDEEEWHGGKFYFKNALLDKLPSYFICLRRMKFADKEAYDIYKRLGAHIVPDSGYVPMDALDDGVLTSWFKKTRPGFGAIFILNYEEDYESFEGKQTNRCFPRFMYFRKYDSAHVPPRIERRNSGDTYVVTMYFDETKSGIGTIPVEFPVLLNDDGAIIPLRTLNIYRKTFPGKRKSYLGKTYHKKARRLGKGREATIPIKTWETGNRFMQTWATENIDKFPDRDVTKFMMSLFAFCASQFELTSLSSAISVDVKKDDTHAVFGVHEKRTAYFFKDRESVLVDGKKKRIFHMVKAHARTLIGGKQSFVRFHFRGLREFLWNGYQIKISVPGRDHLDLAECDIAGHDYAEDVAVPGTTDSKGFAKMLRKAVDNA